MRITGGNDKQGFPMKQGILTNNRVRLLLSKGHSCYRSRRSGERKRRSVRGCIVDANLSALALIIVKKGNLFILMSCKMVFLLKVIEVGVGGGLWRVARSLFASNINFCTYFLLFYKKFCNHNMLVKGLRIF